MRLLRDVLVLITLVCSVVPSRAQSRDVQSADWSVQAKPSVVEMGFDKNAVAAFVNSLVGDPEDPLTANQIGDFKWLDVDKDGVYELLVTYDVTKRAFFGGPAIFKSIAGKKRWHQFLSGWELKELDGAIEDLDRDGLPELIVPIRLSEYRGARPIAVWPAVCKWNGDKFVDASGQFRTFYEQRVLPEIEAEIRRLTAEAKQRQQTSLGYDEVMDERLAVAGWCGIRLPG